ncbi:MAG: hypothetical protein GXO91_09650, partial [FCB group bacterium]|nr:hypothetical protein [FCB group bacterium]
MKNTIRAFISIITLTFLTGQFGQNIVQYDKFNWEFIQSTHFDIYFTGNGENHAEFTAREGEAAYENISKRMGWTLNDRVSIIIYNSHNDFQQTNVLDTYMYEGIGGVTELYKNRVVVPYDGSHREFKHVIHHELVHAFINENIYGGNLQNLISSRIKFMIPGWMNEGLAEYLSDGWSTNSDMWMRDLAINGGELPDIYRLNGYLSYRGGQSVWRFIAQKWGEESFSEIFYQIKKNNSVEKGLEQALGVNLKELSKQWHKYLKKEYWPDVAGRDNLPDIADRLTDHEKLENSYNIAPAISPDGSRVAIISNKSGSFGMYLISASDGKFLRKIIQGENTAEFEELHILKPGLSWSPDGERLAFGAKSGKSDALFIVDVKSRKTRKYRLGMEGIYRPAWNPVRDEIAFVGNDGANSDIYLYDLETDSLTNLTADWFTEDQVSWSPDGQSLLFISDRGSYLDVSAPEHPDSVSIDQMDIYKIDRTTRTIERLTDTEFNESYPILSKDGKTLAFISDESGINNVYLLNDTLARPQAITNVLTGISQLSLSSDDVQLVVTGFEKSGYDIYALSNPLERLDQKIQVEPAKWKTMKPPELRHRPSRRDISTMKVSYDNYIFTNYGKPAKVDSVSVPAALTDEAIKDST